MPYVKSDIEDMDINYVDTVTTESNYGGFPCDFVLVNSYVETDSFTNLSYRKNIELDRLRYLDIIRMYREYNEVLKESVILRKVQYTEEKDVFIDCVNSGNSETETITDIRWTTTKTDGVSIFDCQPIDSMYLMKDGNYYYKHSQEVERMDFLENKELEYGLTDEETDELNRLNSIYNVLLEENEYIILVKNYDDLVEYDNFWENWWTNNFNLTSYAGAFDSWETLILDSNYSGPQYFKFYYDVEKYILGRVNVPEENDGETIKGGKVPNYVYYINFNDYKDWFDENIGLINTDDSIQNEWNERGGFAFYNFLNTISPKFLNHLDLPEEGRLTGFTFMPPVINIDFSFIDECIPFDTYKPYELSVDINSNVVDGTFEYSASTHGVGSALTPTFKTFEDGELNVESKLSSLRSNNVYYINDKIFGVFNGFENDGQMFNCVYHTGDTHTHPLRVRYFTVSLYEYQRRADEWILVRHINIPEQVDSTISTEQMPKAGESTYQIVGIKLIDSAVTIENEHTEPYETIVEDKKYLSAYTFYDKKTVNTYGWWSCHKEGHEGLRCGDGENIDFSTANKYRNLLLLSCVPSACETESGIYHYMVKYDNGYTNIGSNTFINTGSTIKKLQIPYELNVRTNITSLDGEFSGTTIYDEVLAKEIVSVSGVDKLSISYVIGATSGDDVTTSGIHYNEDFFYTGVSKANIVIDGKYDGEIFYEKIESENIQTISNEKYNLTRKAQIAKVTGMEIGTQWTSASCVNAYLFTEDSSDNLLDYPNISVDISFNRGNAAIWEKRFKLAECNTLEDLENYGNNYFNL
jgi:hypothetical protein